MHFLYKNWTVHNIFGHLLMEVFRLIGLKKLGAKIHDVTVPQSSLRRQQYEPDNDHATPNKKA